MKVFQSNIDDESREVFENEIDLEKALVEDADDDEEEKKDKADLEQQAHGNCNESPSNNKWGRRRSVQNGRRRGSRKVSFLICSNVMVVVAIVVMLGTFLGVYFARKNIH
jgi:hypothetical protein